MSRQGIIAIVLVGVAAAAFLLTPSGRAVSQSVQRVFVTNHPPVQRITGEVEIKGPVREAEMQAFREITVPPVMPAETTRLVDAGMLVTDGFLNMVLSLHGSTKGSVQKRGTIGAILVPDEERIQQAFNEEGLMHFALETAAPGVFGEMAYFASNQPQFTIGFQQYRVLLYNTTDKAVSVDLYAYLTN
jgi:hypothetical protein